MCVRMVFFTYIHHETSLEWVMKAIYDVLNLIQATKSGLLELIPSTAFITLMGMTHMENKELDHAGPQ